MNRLVLGLTVAVLAVAAEAQAQAWNDLSTRTRRWDFSVQTRYTGSRDFDGKLGSKVSLDDDLGWGFAFDYNINEKLSLGFTTAWRNVSYNATVANSDPVGNPQFQYYNSGLYASMIGINGTFNLLPKRFTPYAAGGVGWTLVDTNIVADYQTGCWWDPWWGYICDTYAQTYGTDAASFALGEGLRLGLSPQVFARIGYEDNWLDLDSVDGADVFRVDFGASF